MSQSDRTLAAIIRAAKVVNQQLPKEKRIGETADAPLLGDSTELDSLGLITFLVAVEQEIANEFQVTIDLIEDASDLSEENSSFDSISTLARLISEQLEEA